MPVPDALPPLKDRLLSVMGDGEELSISEIATRLEEAGLGPSRVSDNNLQSYISFMLSSHKEDFERVRRGVYRRLSLPSPVNTEREAALRRMLRKKAPKKKAAKKKATARKPRKTLLQQLMDDDD